MVIDDNIETALMFEAVSMAMPEVMFYVYQTPMKALEMLYALNYEVDALVTDLMMASMDGMSLTTLVRESEKVTEKPPLPIYWYTGWPVNMADRLDPVTKVFHETGVKKIFRKPFDDPQKMIAEIREDIKSREELSHAA